MHCLEYFVFINTLRSHSALISHFTIYQLLFPIFPFSSSTFLEEDETEVHPNYVNDSGLPREW